MAKLIGDPKVAALVEKSAEKATKEANKASIATVKEQFDAAITDAGDAKATVKLLKTVQKAVVDALKAA